MTTGAATGAPNAAAVTPSATTTPIGVSAGGGTPPPAATPAPADWTSGFSDDLKGYVQNKGFKDPSAAIESYRNLEKLMGAPRDRLVTLPEKSDDPAWGEIYNRLGKPAKPEEYKIQMPQTGGDEKFAEWAKGTFHKLNLTNAQAEKLSGEWNAYVAQGMQAQEQIRNEKNIQEETGLKQKWGAAYDENVGVAGRAAREFGINEDMLDQLEASMGYAKTMEFLHGIGSKISEGGFVTPSAVGGFKNLTPEAARNQIKALQQDTEFTAKLLSKNVEAKEQWDRLHQMAYGS